MNMGYCRFENTAVDLQDCFDHLADQDLSASEQKLRARLISLCQQIADNYGEDEDEDE